MIYQKKMTAFFWIFLITANAGCANDYAPIEEAVTSNESQSQHSEPNTTVDGTSSATTSSKSEHQIDAEISLETIEVDKNVSSLKSKLSALNGRIVSESMNGRTDDQDYNRLVVRLPYQNFDRFFAYVKTLGKVTRQSLKRRSIAEDFETVTRDYNNQPQKQEPRATASKDAELIIEFNKPRLNGGRKMLGLSYSELTSISLLRKEGSEKKKPNQAKGGLVTFSSAGRDISFDIGSFKADGEDLVGIATIGIGDYLLESSKDFSKFFNPWLAFKLGALTQGGTGNWVFGIEMGLELFRTEKFIVHAQVQPAMVLGSGTSGTIVTSSFGAAFTN